MKVRVYRTLPISVRKTIMRGDLPRYVLWARVLATANANRLHFGLASTWVYHTTGNTLSLLLPELYGSVARLLRLDERTGGFAPFHRVMRDVVRDNPRYVTYVAPLAVAYALSHPRFNIYKGVWARRQIFGFGLDSIPHAATAFALTRLIFDLLAALDHHLPPTTRLVGGIRWAHTHRVLVAGAVLTLATVIYETGEWMIYQSEMEATGGNPERMNMEWGAVDTVTDVLSNIAGWLLAIKGEA